MTRLIDAENLCSAPNWKVAADNAFGGRIKHFYESPAAECLVRDACFGHRSLPRNVRDDKTKGMLQAPWPTHADKTKKRDGNIPPYDKPAFDRGGAAVCSFSFLDEKNERERTVRGRGDYCRATSEGANIGNDSVKVTDKNCAQPYETLFDDINRAVRNPKPYPKGYGRDRKLGRAAVAIAKRTYKAFRDIRRQGKVRCRDNADPKIAIEAAKAEEHYWRKTPDWQTVPVRPYLPPLLVLVLAPAWFACAVWPLLFRRARRCPQYAVVWIGRGRGPNGNLRETEVLSLDAIKRSLEHNKLPTPARQQFGLPSEEEALALIEQSRAGNLAARNRLMLGFWDLARSIAARAFATADSTNELAIQALLGTPNRNGIITNGLAYAINKYDPNGGRSFKNYAAEAMRWAIRKYLNDNPSFFSLNADKFKDDDDRPITWLDGLVDETPDYVAESEWLRASIILDSLDPRARQIFIARHSFADKRPTLHDLARRFNCSHETVRRTLLKAEAFVRQQVGSVKNGPAKTIKNITQKETAARLPRKAAAPQPKESFLR